MIAFPRKTPFSKLCLVLSLLLLNFPAFAQDSLEPITPSGKFYPPGSENPELEYSHFDTYNTAPREKGPEGMDEFPKSSTSRIYVGLEVKNLLFNEQDQAYKLTIKYFQRPEKPFRVVTANFPVSKDWEYAWYYTNFGWDTPGYWPLGIHRVEVWINDTKFASKNFKITEG